MAGPRKGFRVAAPIAFTLICIGCATERPLTTDDATRFVRVGTVVVDADDRAVIATGHVNQVEGAIELLACGERGKTHESVFALDVYPVDLQTALLLIGAKYGTPATQLGMGPPHGDPLDVIVEWKEGSRTMRRRAESFIRNVKTGRVLPKTDWVFTGSTMEDGRFMALAEESLIVSYWDPWAIINIGSDVGSDDEILCVNKRAVPPLGTPVTVIIKRKKI